MTTFNHTEWLERHHKQRASQIVRRCIADGIPLWMLVDAINIVPDAAPDDQPQSVEDIQCTVLESPVRQLQAVTHVEPQTQTSPQETYVILYALCEDGSVWEQWQIGRKPFSSWRMVQPQTKGIET